VQKGSSGMPESQLRWKQAKVADPQSASDWEDAVVLDVRLQSSDGSPPGDMAGAPPPPDMAGMAAKPAAYELLPEGIALMASAARRADGTPGVAYYDFTRGNLRLVEMDPMTKSWGKPVIVDGEDAKGVDSGDVGRYSSLAYDDKGVVHIAYEDVTRGVLRYYDGGTQKIEVADDGYFPKDESTSDNLDSPVWHFVGDSASLQLAGDRVVVAYQDATVLELMLAVRTPDGKWSKTSMAGHGNPFKGSFGFYATLRMTGGGAGEVSSYAVNQMTDPTQYFVQVFDVPSGSIP
jgi:hypothetical protein